jgi:hypothetical protein
VRDPEQRRALEADPRFDLHAGLASWGLAWHRLRPFPGYTGHPGLARADVGAELARQVVDMYAPVVQAVLEGRAEPPEPVMAWVERLAIALQRRTHPGA